jgi:hypothetical protein
LILTENQVDEWVRGNARDAQGVIVETVYRLVAASAPRPRERRFPLGDSIGQHGPDGILDVEVGLEPYVPDGRSFWEIGTGTDAGDKATSDYNGLTTSLPLEVRHEASFIFVTPLSGRRDWEHSWKPDAQGTWLTDRVGRGDWKDVRVIDGTRLAEWLNQFPAVELWLAERILGMKASQMESTGQRWDLLKSIGSPPPLTPGVFLANRDEAKQKLSELLSGASLRLKLETHYPDQVADFVSAHIESLDESLRPEAAGRSLAVSGTDAWNTLVTLRDPHVLIASEDVDLNGDAGTRLIQRARQGGHSVIFGGPPGGIPDPTSIVMRSPSVYQLQEALRAAGHGDERARTLAQRSDGNLGTLLRVLQNLSVLPEWAEGPAASDLAIAAILGSWDEGSEADVEVVEGISGNAYGAWIDRIRDITRRPGTPLTQTDGVWRFRARYEGWYALGPRLYADHVERFASAATAVLGELDPALDISVDERPLASIRGMTMRHSESLRHGLAESLALLGSDSQALTSVSQNRSDVVPSLVVRDVLSGADWRTWATLDRLLPELAEGAPEAFLEAVHVALRQEPSPSRELFDQEGGGVIGMTYTSGLLWALETLAWSPDYLVRVSITLGRMAAIDPGGNWANRPNNSLTTMFLPWLPQTTAHLPRRLAALNALIGEVPEIAWTLLVSLLPNASQISSGSRRPSWRDWIPEDWPERVTRAEYAEQVRAYSEIAIRAAEGDVGRITTLIEQIDDLPAESRDVLISYLEGARERPEEERERLWKTLAAIVNRHQVHSDQPWAMPTELVERLTAVRDLIAPRRPSLRHQRLFSERTFDLFERRDDYAAQHAELEQRRNDAVAEIAATDGLAELFAFARQVETPWRVGVAHGLSPSDGSDQEILPALLASVDRALLQFAGGYVWGRFTAAGWEWVDALPLVSWSPNDIGRFLAYLPFESETWTRASRLLADESVYWSQTTANPYGSKTKDFTMAVDRLVDNARPFAAIRCLYFMYHSKQDLDSAQVVRVLLAAASSDEDRDQMSSFEVIEVIKSLQTDEHADPGAVLQIEWAYLPILDSHSGASPLRLERRLAQDPAFFAELIRSTFKSKEADEEERLSPEQAANGYRLLSDWRIPPGLGENGGYDGAVLENWLGKVSELTAISGHRDIAMTMAGHVLIHVPPDPSGMWIHRGAARALNSEDAQELRIGFRTGLRNSRGVHFVDPSGAQERELAAQYRRQADEVEEAGFHRLAIAMREIAAAYEREATDVVARHGAESE